MTNNIATINAQLMKQPDELKKQIKTASSFALFRIGLEMKTTAVGLAPHKAGTLRRSIFMSPNNVYSIKDNVVVGTPLVYGAQRDFGGTITARRAKYLTIPIGGVRGSIKNYKGFFMRSKTGNLLFVQNVGKGKIKPLFVLKKSVFQKGKPYLTRAFDIIKLGRGIAILNEEFARIGVRIK